MRFQTNAWPYPQSRESHIAVWRDSWKKCELAIPRGYIRVPLIYSDCPGVLMCVREDAPTPREVVACLLDGEEGQR